MTLDRQAYIEEVFKGSPLYSTTAETGGVGSFTPTVGNKLITAVKDYTMSCELSKDLFDLQKVKLMLYSITFSYKLLLNNLLSVRVAV